MAQYRNQLTVPVFVLLTALALDGAGQAMAAEGGTGWYLLGSKTEMAGFLPPPGVFAQSSNYYYSGSTNAELEFGGLTLSGGIDAEAFYTLPTVLWVVNGDVLGGNIAFSFTAPIGWKNVEAKASVSGPGGGTILSTNIDDEDFDFGDPVFGATLGWHDGNFHWNLGTLVNVPIGFWKEGNASNIGFNHWGIDVSAALTWLDPALGLELSGATGLTFNFENPDTDYTTGTEFHAEFAATKIVSQQFSFGLNGYYYEQVSGDSGSGATLGDFEGRVVGLGPALNYTLMAGHIPVSTNLRYFHEFEVKNRLSGEAFFLNVGMPLYVAGQ